MQMDEVRKLMDELIEKVNQYNQSADLDLIRKGYEFAKCAHEGQKRLTGEPYIIHPVCVAILLAEIEMDTESIVAALLHDTVEDTEVTLEDITQTFGENIALLVDGVTKLGRIPYSSKQEEQVENLRKMFVAMAKDIRVIFIKLADRLHNMRTLRYQSEEKQREKSLETMEIFAPLAHRLGIFKFKWELEDIALRYLDPIGYQEIIDNIKQKREEREEYLETIKKSIEEKLCETIPKFHIEGRVKHFYSIYKKMYSQNKTIDEIYDLFAVRVIVDTVADCYAVLGAVHELYKPMPGRFKDYIAMPKPNMYQSLHSTVIGTKGTPFEVQIRTWEMHKTAEYGIAAHWKYKEGKTTSKDDFDTKMAWVRELMEIQKDLTDAEEFMQTLKIDLFADEVFVFTPRGDVINLPNGSTPIDFAFAIHSAVGYKMLGAKVNGKIVTIDYKLQNGDIVEIITSSAVHGPSRDWLKVIKTNQAKNKINQWFKKENRAENITIGHETLEKEIKRLGIEDKALVSQILNTIYKRYSYHSLEDLYANIGYGGVPVSRVITKFRDEYRKLQPGEPVKQQGEMKRPSKKDSTGIIVKGIDNCLVRFARCCNPVPGDDITGYITRGRGVSIHRSDCNSIQEARKSTAEMSRLIEVKWSDEVQSVYTASILYIGYDRTGLLTDIASTISEFKVSVNSLNARKAMDGTALIDITIEITSKNQLEVIMKKLRSLPGTIDVKRATGKKG